ncbi:hypothetical protein [Nonomuraea sp. NPDC005501]
MVAEPAHPREALHRNRASDRLVSGATYRFRHREHQDFLTPPGNAGDT